MKKLTLSLATLMMLSGPALATRTPDIEIPNNITLQGESLVLNGSGVRCKFFIDLYVGSLFTAETSQDPQAIINSEEPTAVRLNITSNVITSEKMKRGMREGFELATRNQENKLETKINDFITTFEEPIQKGDQFTLLSVPGEGLISYKNGQFLSITSGEDFRKIVLSIWLGNKPTDKSLKKDMLGL